MGVCAVRMHGYILVRTCGSVKDTNVALLSIEPPYS